MGLLGHKEQKGSKVQHSRYAPAVLVPDDHAVAADAVRHIDRGEASEPEGAAHRLRVLARPVYDRNQRRSEELSGTHR